MIQAGHFIAPGFHSADIEPRPRFPSLVDEKQPNYLFRFKS